ncbi:unnamed protein product [Auanema sp. JU1783]|nr:unnamed protein product [Auanema sp. JU1783]
MVSDEFRIRSAFTLSPEAFLAGLKGFDTQCRMKKKIYGSSTFHKMLHASPVKKLSSKTETSSSYKGGNYLSDCLLRWAKTNSANYYPTREQKKELSVMTLCSMATINRWFVNRRRSNMKRIKLKSSHKHSGLYRPPPVEEQMEEDSEGQPEEESEEDSDSDETASEEQLSPATKKSESSFEGRQIASDYAHVISQADLEKLLQTQVQKNVDLRSHTFENELMTPSTSSSTSIFIPETAPIPDSGPISADIRTTIPVSYPPSFASASIPSPTLTALPNSIATPVLNPMPPSIPLSMTTSISTPLQAQTSPSDPASASTSISTSLLSPIQTSFPSSITISNQTPLLPQIPSANQSSSSTPIPTSLLTTMSPSIPSSITTSIPNNFFNAMPSFNPTSSSTPIPNSLLTAMSPSIRSSVTTPIPQNFFNPVPSSKSPSISPSALTPLLTPLPLSIPSSITSSIPNPFLTPISNCNTVPISTPMQSPLLASLQASTSSGIPASIPPSMSSFLAASITTPNLAPTSASTSGTASASTTSPSLDDHSFIYPPPQQHTLPDINPLMNDPSLRKILLTTPVSVKLSLPESVVDILQPQLAQELLRISPKDLCRCMENLRAVMGFPSYGEQQQAEHFYPSLLQQQLLQQLVLSQQALYQSAQTIYENPLLATLLHNSPISTAQAPILTPTLTLDFNAQTPASVPVSDCEVRKNTTFWGHPGL